MESTAIFQVAENQGGRLEDRGQAVEKPATPFVVSEDMLEEILGVSIQCHAVVVVYPRTHTRMDSCFGT